MAIKQRKASRDGSNSQSCNAILSEWIDNSCGIDLLGCDETCATRSRPTLLGSEVYLRKAQDQNFNIQTINYAALHDELVEALLYEQAQKQNDSTEMSSEFNGSLSSFGSSAAFDTEERVEEPTQEIDKSAARKRRRPVKLSRRRSPPRLGGRGSHAKNDSSMQTISFADLCKKKMPNPEIFIHPQCRMQKDKGLGEAVGSAICSKGREACLEKLRTKMRLLAEHALGDSSKASVKRRAAAVSERHSNFVETRSLVELRMGFLSMQYGVLLRWDTGKTGKVTLVVLRKMCHDNFYPRKPVASVPNTPMVLGSATNGDGRGGPLSGARTTGINQPRLLDPPYLVSKPPYFPPSVLEVGVASVSGLHPRSNWILQVAYEDCLENFVLAVSGNQLIPKERDLRLRKDVNPEETLRTLEVKLFERRRRQQRRLVTTLRVPLQGLQPQSSKTYRHYKRVQLALTHDSYVHLEMLFTSDSMVWLRQELEARKQAQEEATVAFIPDMGESLVDENDDPWDWLICCAC